MASAPTVQLSKADSRVLAQVFDPESGPARAEIIVDPSLPADQHLSSTTLEELKRREKEAVSLIEAFEKSREKTESRKESVFRQALSQLNQIVDDFPDYASARNNRAQLRRWRFGDRNLLCQARDALQRERAEAAVTSIDDLKAAITLASPAKPQDAVSPSQGRLLGQAYTQLAAIYHAASKDLHESEGWTVVVPDCQEWTVDRFEEEASRLFYLGGLYGNEVAKALAVHTNPHAKLCGSIVKEAMKKELSQR